jgi:hypothetical protein
MIWIPFCVTEGRYLGIGHADRELVVPLAMAHIEEHGHGVWLEQVDTVNRRVSATRSHDPAAGDDRREERLRGAV